MRSSSVPVTHADLSGSGPHKLIALSLIHLAGMHSPLVAVSCSTSIISLRKSCKLRMRVKFNTLVQIYSVGFLHLQLIHILALSPQVTVYIAWVLARHIQVWNQDSLGYGMESGWCRLHCKPFSRAQLLELRF